jgi:hypothetical protein
MSALEVSRYRNTKLRRRNRQFTTDLQFQEARAMTSNLRRMGQDGCICKRESFALTRQRVPGALMLNDDRTSLIR